MRDFKRLIHEIHRRSLWQVLAIYLGASWAVVQAADHVVKQFALPPWTYGMVFLLLLIGLPVVLATAFVQERPPAGEEAGDDGSAAHSAHSRGAHDGGRTGRGGEADRGPFSELFTWRNAIAGGVAALALWGLIAAAWVLVVGTPPQSADAGIASWTSREGPIGRSPAAGAADPEADGTSETGPGASEVGRAAHEQSTGAGRDEAANAEGTDLAAAEEGTAAPRPSGDAVERASPERSAAAVEEPVEARPPPANRPPALAGPPPSYRRAWKNATSGREAALQAGAQSLAARSLDRGDSLFTAGLRESGRDRHHQAEDLMEAAAMAFDRARREAAAAWNARLDSTAAAVARARRAADPEAQQYGEASDLEDRAAREADAGAHQEAFASLRRAVALYEDAAAPDAAAESPREDAEPAEPVPAGEERDAGAAEAGPSAPPREAVEEAFGRLAAAFGAEDMDAVRSVWVNLTAQQVENFRSFFSRYEDIEVAFDVQWDSMRASDGHAHVLVATTWRYLDPSTGRPERPPTFEQPFEVGQRDDRTVLLSR